MSIIQDKSNHGLFEVESERSWAVFYNTENTQHNFWTWIQESTQSKAVSYKQSIGWMRLV